MLAKLKTKLAKLEDAADVRRGAADDARWRAGAEAWLAAVNRDPEARALCRALGRRMLGRTSDPATVPFERADLIVLPAHELRRRLDERLRAGRWPARDE